MSVVDTLKERVRNLEKRMDSHEKMVADGFDNNSQCHASLKSKLSGIESTLAVIDTKLGGLTRVFWLVVGAFVTAAVSVIVTAVVVVIKNGGV